MKLLIYPVLLLILTSQLFADPTFVTTTFDSGLEGWLPDKWQTSTTNGLSLGNPYLRMAADGSGEIGKVVTFNQDSEWTGNYITAGVNGINLDIVNMSSSDVVYLRILLGNRGNPQQSGGTWFLSETAIVIPAQSSWATVFLPLEENNMTKVGNLMGQVGTDTYEETFENIQAIRIMSARSKFSVIGDEFLGVVGVDNISLVPEPSTMPLIGLGGLIIFYGRRRNRQREVSSELPSIPKGASPNRFLVENRF